MNYVEMSEEEMNLLCKVYFGEERIKQGNLYDYEKVALDEFRAGKKYLKEKYPSYPMKVLSYAPANKLNGSAEIEVQAPDGETYKMIIHSADNELECVDNFYASLIQEAYNIMLEDIISGAGLKVRAHVAFPEMTGIEINEKSTLEEVLKVHPKLNRLVRLYYDGADSYGIKNRIEECIKNAGLYGSYSIYFVSENFDRSMEELEASRSDWDMDFFTNFDVK